LSMIDTLVSDDFVDHGAPPARFRRNRRATRGRCDCYARPCRWPGPWSTSSPRRSGWWPESVAKAEMSATSSAFHRPAASSRSRRCMCSASKTRSYASTGRSATTSGSSARSASSQR